MIGAALCNPRTALNEAKRLQAVDSMIRVFKIVKGDPEKLKNLSRPEYVPL